MASDCTDIDVVLRQINQRLRKLEKSDSEKTEEIGRTPIGPNDTAIAGHAIAAGAILVTNNTREFERVPGLVLEDWVK